MATMQVLSMPACTSCYPNGRSCACTTEWQWSPEPQSFTRSLAVRSTCITTTVQYENGIKTTAESHAPRSLIRMCISVRQIDTVRQPRILMTTHSRAELQPYAAQAMGSVGLLGRRGSVGTPTGRSPASDDSPFVPSRTELHVRNTLPTQQRTQCMPTSRTRSTTCACSAR